MSTDMTVTTGNAIVVGLYESSHIRKMKMSFVGTCLLRTSIEQALMNKCLCHLKHFGAFML